MGDLSVYLHIPNVSEYDWKRRLRKVHVMLGNKSKKKKI